MSRLQGLAVLFVIGAWSAGAMAQTPDSPFIEDLTWTEVAARTAAGITTIIIPAGGIEQSGPAMALGKHDARARFLAGRIARRLGDALVAPVVSYVPEGEIEPPTQHMRFPGTISIPSSVFRATIESAAMSLKLHGFKTIVLLGDHGGYQNDLKLSAEALNRRWAATEARALFVPQYYSATQGAYVTDLKRKGFSQSEIGTHAGLADTSLTMAIAPAMVRPRTLRVGQQFTATFGVYGDPRRSTAALGQVGVEEIISQTVAAVKNERKRWPSTPRRSGAGR